MVLLQTPQISTCPCYIAIHMCAVHVFCSQTWHMAGCRWPGVFHDEEACFSMDEKQEKRAAKWWVSGSAPSPVLSACPRVLPLRAGSYLGVQGSTNRLWVTDYINILRNLSTFPIYQSFFFSFFFFSANYSSSKLLTWEGLIACLLPPSPASQRISWCPNPKFVLMEHCLDRTQ